MFSKQVDSKHCKSQLDGKGQNVRSLVQTLSCLKMERTDGGAHARALDAIAIHLEWLPNAHVLKIWSSGWCSGQMVQLLGERAVWEDFRLLGARH